MIQLDRLSKQFGAFKAVKALSLHVADGEIFGFLGPNGSGKTTTINMLMGILVPTSGTATIAGLDCQTDRIAVKQQVGYLPDTPFFYSYLRGREVVEFVGEMHGLDKKLAQRRAGELIEQMGLQEAREEFAVNFSLGMRKRLALACALVHDPPLLILDEPTNSLDPHAARAVQTLMRTRAEAGKTVFLSTHLLEMAEACCHRVGIINQGNLVVTGEVGDLRRQAGGTLTDIFFQATSSAALTL